MFRLRPTHVYRIEKKQVNIFSVSLPHAQPSSPLHRGFHTPRFWRRNLFAVVVEARVRRWIQFACIHTWESTIGGSFCPVGKCAGSKMVTTAVLALRMPPESAAALATLLPVLLFPRTTSPGRRSNMRCNAFCSFTATPPPPPAAIVALRQSFSNHAADGQAAKKHAQTWWRCASASATTSL